MATGTGNGDLGGWTPDTDEGPLPQADATCQQEAAAAGFEGTAPVDPLCRLYGYDGLLAGHCGQAEGRYVAHLFCEPEPNVPEQRS